MVGGVLEGCHVDGEESGALSETKRKRRKKKENSLDVSSAKNVMLHNKYQICIHYI